MGSEFSIDVDSVSMFGGEEWWDLGEPCTHDCPHNAQTTVGWGPTTVLYELLHCDLCDCRAWEDGRYAQERTAGNDASFWRAHDWRQKAT